MYALSNPKSGNGLCTFRNHVRYDFLCPYCFQPQHSDAEVTAHMAVCQHNVENYLRNQR
ncbi:hypothetical protein DL89DRAFT_268149 [Linderina pennispora]|uniref:Uncharacterized protein n=1 Tax=Linderina pennispora TaxID=61395 RepID=A0A1Y1W725_9FUNG|nr:uncharacterized protein DL89DRAFT_268149 [Linderina pennispora]ORX69128.1 hypothetical protein DL89DRAFT_268149 [Linderina pennispora]